MSEDPAAIPTGPTAPTNPVNPPGPPARRRGRLIGGLVAGLVVVAAAVVVVVVTSGGPKTGADCLVGTWRSISATESSSDESGTTTSNAVAGTETVTYRADGTGGYTDAGMTFASTSGTDRDVIDAAVTFHYTVAGGVVTYTSVAGSQSITTTSGGTASPAQTDPVTQLDPSTYTCRGDTLTESQSSTQVSYTYSTRYARS